MAASPTAIVNQRLYYCRLHLDWLSVITRDADSSPAAFYAAEESLVYHLIMAYQAYLEELADKFGCIDLHAATAVELAAKIVDQGYRPSELGQLLVLETSPDSWLSTLQACYQGRATIDFNPATPNAEINIISINNELGGKVKADCKNIFDSLKSLIDSQRETTEEW
jgi:hypothetical protein